jgi:pyruvate dehydrogenase E2 component (dihydrolipoamide acetyltransferase)
LLIPHLSVEGLLISQSPVISAKMVAAAARMRTPSAMFMVRGATPMRRPQAAYKFQDVLQYVQWDELWLSWNDTDNFSARRSQLPSISALSRYYASKCMAA